MKILITGGCGFIGSNLADELFKNGHTVDVVDDCSTGSLNNIKSPFRVVITDLVDRFNQELRNNKILIINGDYSHFNIINFINAKIYDCVYHFAANPSVTYSFENLYESNNNNLSKAIKIFEACSKSNTKLIFSSSSSIYGQKNYLTNFLSSKESDYPEPISPYGIQKITCESYIEFFNKNKSFPYVILRYSNVYGPRANIQSNIKYGTFIPTWCHLINNNKKIIFEGNGLQSRDLIYIDDVTKANIKALDNKFNNKIFNISSNTSIMLKEVFEKIIKFTKNTNFTLNNEVEKTEPRKLDVSYTKLNNSLAINEGILDKKLINIDDGLKMTLKWWNLIN